jgi:hypothetical protein
VRIVQFDAKTPSGMDGLLVVRACAEDSYNGHETVQIRKAHRPTA